ncbi:MAG: FAD-binding protein [Pseudomonadota bacterium]|nr:FAD-binding protein [Pseudomonadota bacterium]
MAILILAEPVAGAPSPATLSTITAARKLGNDVHLLVAGQGMDAAAKAAAQITGVSKVLVTDHASLAQGLAEALAPVVAEMAKQGYSHVLAPATTFGKNALPRVAALMDSAQVSDVIAIHGPDTFDRPIYAGNAIATVQCADPVKVLTIRPTAFDAAQATGGTAAVETVPVQPSVTVRSRFVGLQKAESARPELTSARVVVSGGRGLGSKENFKMLEALADTLNAALGASRAAVDAGYVPNDWQVGQTGKIVAPELYIAVGISGAIQHLAGMKDSKVIVAINKDEEAPIMKLADYALAGDLFTLVPELTAALGKKT